MAALVGFSRWEADYTSHKKISSIPACHHDRCAGVVFDSESNIVCDLS